MKKCVYIVQSHHHVIKEWFRHRECGSHLLSFDYHTDFCEAFLRNSYAGSSASILERTYTIQNHNLVLGKHIACRDENAIESAVNDLRNDEHIDFAIRSGMIKRAFVFSCSLSTFNDGRVLTVPPTPPVEMSEDQVQEMRMLNMFAPKVPSDTTECETDAPPAILVGNNVEGGIVSYSESCHPFLVGKDEFECAKLVMTDRVLDEVLKTFREHGFNQDNYILDFDCDFIRDRGAMTQDKFNTFKTLIRGAKAITIALEPSCVMDCSGGEVTCEEVENWLVAQIKECVDADIKYESDN